MLIPVQRGRLKINMKINRQRASLPSGARSSAKKLLQDGGNGPPPVDRNRPATARRSLQTNRLARGLPGKREFTPSRLLTGWSLSFALADFQRVTRPGFVGLPGRRGAARPDRRRQLLHPAGTWATTIARVDRPPRPSREATVPWPFGRETGFAPLGKEPWRRFAFCRIYYTS